MRKERVDVLLVERGFFDSREKAKRAIMAGIIHNEHEILDKPGMKIPADTPLFVKGQTLKYVSRGGLKLEKAIDTFGIDLEDCNVLDIGSSTGGFTDCALQHGASHVYALDVGTNQLVWQLRSDPRVTVLEQTNFRYATPELFTQGQPDFATIDVSFISLGLIFGPLHRILKPEGDVVALIKPQFEAGRDQVGKHGIVKDPKVHEAVIHEVLQLANQNGFTLMDLTYSPITGGEGNIEFLGYFQNVARTQKTMAITEIVKQAHEAFRG